MNRKNNHIIVWDTNDNVPNDGKLYYKWNGYSEEKNIKSLLYILENNSIPTRESFFQARLAFIQLLYRSYNIKYSKIKNSELLFWMSSIIESSNIKEKAYPLDVMRLLLLNNIIKI